MATILELNTALLNANVFFREFTFPKTIFPTAAGDQELADHLVCLDDVALAIQSKERGVRGKDEDAERKWFKQEVLGQAAAQMNGTIDWMRREPDLQITNDRGRTVRLGEVRTIVPVVLYENDTLSDDCVLQRHKVSKRSGEFMHLMSWEDYELSCRVLYTPIEMLDYFEFRKAILNAAGSAPVRVSERALLGQFLAGADADRPDERFASYVDRLIVDLSTFDLRDIIEKFPARIVTATGDYYPVVNAVARLDRADLAQFLIRFRLAMTAAYEGRSYGPTRMISTRENRGFVFASASPDESPEKRAKLHEVFTRLAKHDQRLDKQIGVSFSKDGNCFDILWAVMDHPWQPDIVLDSGLIHLDPFPPLRSEPKQRYRFSGE